jgi:hypothetical protein
MVDLPTAPKLPAARYKMKFSPDYEGVDTETVRRWQFFKSLCIAVHIKHTPRHTPFAPHHTSHTTHTPHHTPSTCPPPKKALQDFLERIRKYEQVYEPINDRRLHYIKLIDM